MSYVVTLLKKLISIPSITGNEQDMCHEVLDILTKAGFKTQKIPVSGNRFNIIATLGTPKVYLSAHLDTVAPYLPFRETSTQIFGRGSCDTKSCIAAMLAAGLKVKETGLSDFGYIFTVGEEGNFDGARKIKELGTKIPFIVVGEPTSLEIVNGHFGMLVLKITAKGKAAHSSTPEKGVNAINILLSAINQIQSIPIHPDSLMSLVKISGGVADNIIPAESNCVFSFRLHPQDKNDYQKIIRLIIGPGFKVENILTADSVYTQIPQELSFIKKNRIVKYGTDLSVLKNGIVTGPGDIRYAHSNNEQIKKTELIRAVDTYCQIIKSFVVKYPNDQSIQSSCSSSR